MQSDNAENIDSVLAALTQEGRDCLRVAALLASAEAVEHNQGRQLSAFKLLEITGSQMMSYQTAAELYLLAGLYEECVRTRCT